MKIRVVLAVCAVAGTVVGQAFAAGSAAAPAASTNKPSSVVAATGGEIVARVNGAVITRKDLDAAVQDFSNQMARQGRRVPPGQTAALQQSVLDQLIGRQLVLQLPCVRRVDTCLRAVHEELLKPSVLERLDHLSTVSLVDTAVNGKAPSFNASASESQAARKPLPEATGYTPLGRILFCGVRPCLCLPSIMPAGTTPAFSMN